jgi:hypothetical protein
MLRKVFAAMGMVVLASVAFATDLRSGPQAGERLPGPFHPLNINGEYAGKKFCLYCLAEDHPTVAIFARNPDDPVLQKLMLGLEEATKTHAKAEFTSYAVFCSSDEKLEGKLKALAEKSKLKNLIVALDKEAGPEKYNINKDVDVTILLYKDYTVSANYTFDKGKLGEKDVETILSGVSKLVK